MSSVLTQPAAILSEDATFWDRLGIGGRREKRLISAAVNGDRNAFDSLMRDYQQGLRGYLHRRVGPHAVDDVLQDTLLAAWSSIARYKSSWRFKAWLYGIATHKCADYFRSRGALSAETTLEGVEETAVGSFEDQSDTRHRIKQAIDALPDVQRDIIELYYYGDLNLNEIAVATGRNLNTVKYHFYRGHEALGRDLTDDELDTAARNLRR